MQMSDSVISGNLFAAAKQLADSEIQLIKVIENSKSTNNKSITSKMSMSVKKGAKKSAKTSSVRPSAALIAAKREATQQNKLQKKKCNTVFVRDIYQKAIDAYNLKRKETGLVFDRSMAEHKCLWDSNYPECPARLTRVLQRCEELGLVNRCKFIASRQATENEVLLKHSQKQLDILKATDGCTDADNLELLSSKYDAVYIHPSTYNLSLLAVGSTINLVESICKGEVQNGMAIIRPPGHHAMKSEYCGYCFFNNVAIAAEKALSNNLANKILIVDWDVHHGQATQQMFYNDPRVIYFSIHRYENGEFWPNLKESNFHFIGDDLGQGYNFNVPLNKTGMTNADYLAIFQQVLLPMAYEFNPDFVIVSAGFDSSIGDEKGEMLVTPPCYAHLLSSLLSLASGKVAVVLEGGYCLKSLAESAALTLRALLGDPCPMLQNLELPSLSIRDTILNTIYAHKLYWKCYQYQDTYSNNFTAHNKEQNINQHLPVVTFKGSDIRPTVYETRDCYPVQSKDVIEQIEKQLNAIIQITNLSMAPNKVCVVYDDRMLNHRDLIDDSHPEKPNRISGIYKKYEEYNLLDRCYVQQGRSASIEELLLAHSKEYIDKIKDTENLKPKELQKLATTFNSVYLHPETWTSACISTGSLLQVVDSVLNGESQSGVAIVRPPGHHAEEDAPCGFCIFNNIAVAARYATEFHHLKKVLIVDWDVHHGNGTQSIFEEDPKVLYMSVHRYDNGSFFPNSKRANYTSVGSGLGEGFNINIPWNKKGMGDAEYIAAFQQVVMPIAYQFNPELILVSAGFDACIGDPLGGCLVTPEMYGHLTQWLSSLANGRVILSLEGGYNINSISNAMAICTKTLLGDPLPMLESDQIPCSSAINSINNVIKTQKQYWPNLIFNMSLPKENVLPKAKISHTKTNEQVKNIEKVFKQSESKIALEEIESEKLELKISINKTSLNSVTDEEISKLQNEVENIKIKNSSYDDTSKAIEEARNKLLNMQDNDKVSEYTKKCVNQPGKEASSDKNFDVSIPGSSNGQNEGATAQEGAATNLYDYLSQNFQALVDEEMFAVVPLRECPHLNTVRDVPASGIDVHSPCQECGSNVENWICLQCYTVHCARQINQHGILHAEEMDHPLTLSFSDISVWCYRCEAYIDNPRLFAARNAAHQSKFNEELPWTYSEDRSANM
ncbi:histone deacetylase 6 isoform X2 [Hylaeus anthracinus]|uniref:histone deacetylase 6 isoform X2 n=1 Tax=Hylaeus anthracinus TaxID=313031 RepID=UPI0023BA1DD7|nr:histone deacetylase 6 isoform X2 [Hylaeus anthracinus]